MPSGLSHHQQHHQEYTLQLIQSASFLSLLVLASCWQLPELLVSNTSLLSRCVSIHGGHETIYGDNVAFDFVDVGNEYMKSRWKEQYKQFQIYMHKRE
jgi:hypothetical protein